jgi:hypothetical protein
MKKKISVVKSGRKMLLERSRKRQQENIKMFLKELRTCGPVQIFGNERIKSKLDSGGN